MPLQTYANGALFGERYGTSPPRVLALHGWGRDRSDFAGALAGLDAISVDLPGFGASPAPESVWGAADYAMALEPVLSEFDEPPVVVGHSFGGRVATVLAASAPDRVRSLVLVGVPLLHRDDRLPAKPALIYRIARWLHAKGLIGDDRLEQEKRKRGSDDYRAATGVMRDILVKAIGESYERELKRVRCPVHLIWGEHDNDVPVLVAERALKLLSNGSLRVVAGVGHHVPLNAPHEVRATIDALL